MVGSSFSRSQLESRIRSLLYARTLPIQTLGKGMFGDGLVYFPAVNITAIRIILAEAAGPGVLDLNVPVTMPLPPPAGAASQKNPL
jgi:hypothetical protein